MEGNIRPETNVRWCKMQEVRAKLPQHSDSALLNPLKIRPVKPSMSNEVINEKRGSKSVSLKDLCPEDKRRIANLIKELARVSEEKEETKERLKAEHETFEKKIKELEDQNGLIATEREALKEQHKKCQELLTVYQNYLSEQKEKLNHSLHECHNGKLEVIAEKSPPDASISDGPHLGIVPPCTLNAVDKSKHVHVGPSLASHPRCDLGHYFPNHNVPNRVHPSGSLPVQNGCMIKTETSTHGEPIVVRHYNMKDAQAGPSSFTFDTGQNNRNFRPLMAQDAISGTLCDAAVKGRIGMMTGEILYGQEVSKQQLLCQKKELELQKETLQKLLAQQESLLLLKQQQLQESVLDYSRSKHHLSETEDMTYGEVPTNKARISLPNLAGSTERYLTSEDHLYNAPLQKLEGNIKTSTTEPWERLHAGNKIASFAPEFNTFRGTAFYSAGDMSRQQAGTTSLAKKDAATSPLSVFKKDEPVNMATSPIWPESLSYEASLVHLVDTSRPVSSQKHNSHIKEIFTTPRKSNLSLNGYHQSPIKPGAAPTHSEDSDEELEESRMLEDIFFI
ncbi:protein hinderin isoform X2 [Rhinoraja longicauda]